MKFEHTYDICHSILPVLPVDGYGTMGTLFLLNDAELSTPLILLLVPSERLNFMSVTGNGFATIQHSTLVMIKNF